MQVTSKCSPKSLPTYGGDDGTTEEEGGGQVPAAGEVGREFVHIQAGLHRRHHSLQGGGVIYLTGHLSSNTGKYLRWIRYISHGQTLGPH